MPREICLSISFCPICVHPKPLKRRNGNSTYLSNSSDINTNGNGLARNVKATTWSASAFGDTRRGFPLPVPSGLQNSSGPAANGQKANPGQYMTTGHHLQWWNLYIILRGLSREKRIKFYHFICRRDYGESIINMKTSHERWAKYRAGALKIPSPAAGLNGRPFIYPFHRQRSSPE